MKRFTPGKWMGILTLINVIVMLYITLIISIFFQQIDLEEIVVIDKISFGVFAMVWSYVFGSRTVKKLTKKEDEQ